MTRVLVADDHAVVRRGLRQILSEHPDMDEPGEVSDYGELFEALRGEEEWDAVVLDVRMPGGNALDALQRIRKLEPGLAILVLSAHAEDELAVRMIQAGADGYLSKGSASDELMEALRAVLAGRKYVTSALGGRLASSLGNGAGRPAHEALSDREFQVLVGLASGKTVSEVAEELHLSVKTVSTYRRRLLDKMGMSTNAELTRYALERGLA